jgi:NitT/TauT family transport system substrate-binding protein
VNRTGSLVGVLLVGLALAACGGSAAAPAASAPGSGKPASAPAASAPASAPASGAVTPLHVAFTSFNGAEMPLWVAMDSGIFRKHGLDVSGILLQESPAVASLLSGEVQVIQGGGAGTIASAASGSDLKILANVSPYFNFIFVTPNSIKTGADLKGKKLGIAPRGGAVWIATRMTLERLGLNPDTDVTQVSMGVTTERAAAMESGAIDGSILDLIVGQKVVDTGKFHVLYDLAAQKVPYPSSTVVRKSWLADHKDLAQRYIDGLMEGIAKTKEDEALAVATYKKYSKTDDAVAKATYDYFKPLLRSQPLPTPDEFTPTAKIMAEVNPKAANVDVASLIDDSFVKDAVARKVGGA